MEKYKFGIQRKADFIRLTILLHDLDCYEKELQEPISDKESLIRKFRHTRNVFVSLHNLKDALNDVRIENDHEFTDKTRRLRRELQLIGHVRNKGVGHLDKEVLRRAAQWAPELFCESSKDNEDVLIFGSYKALLEISINSYINDRGGKNIFSSEMDFLYPPNVQEFFDFLFRIVNDSINWLLEAREKIKKKIDFHAKDKILEFAKIAGQTNFDLRSDPTFDVDEADTHAQLLAMIDKLRMMGAKEEALEIIKELIK